MDALLLIDHLEDEVTRGSYRIPVVGKALVDVQAVQELVERLRTALPKEMKAAAELRRQERDIVKEAIEAAERIRTAAHRESHARMEDSAVVQEAKAQAEEILAEARRRAQVILEEMKREAQGILNGAREEAEGRRREADGYARQTLEDLHRQLRSIEDQVVRGLDVFQAAVTVPAPR